MEEYEVDEIVKTGFSGAEAEGKPHPIFAGIVDFYIYSAMIIGVEALIVTIFEVKLSKIGAIIYMLLSMLILLVTIIFCIVYYKRLSTKVKWLSIGERITGRRLNEGVKQWFNPYKTNRWGIFVLAFIQMIIIGNNFDGLSNGVIYTMTELIGKYINMGLIIYGLVLLGKGKLKAMYIFLGLHLMSLIIAMISESSILLGLMMFLLIIDVLVFIAYYLLTKKKPQPLNGYDDNEQDDDRD